VGLATFLDAGVDNKAFPVHRNRYDLTAMQGKGISSERIARFLHPNPTARLK
jgi:hypothetical protein